MDVDQPLTQVAQLRGGGGQAVDPGAALAGGVDGASQQQLGLGIEPGFFQPGREGLCTVELGAQVGALCAFAHHCRIGAPTQDELQGLDQNGLARARFAGQRGKALVQIQLQRLDDDEITQNDAFERHAQDPPSFQRSFLRKVSK